MAEKSTSKKLHYKCPDLQDTGQAYPKVHLASNPSNSLSERGNAISLVANNLDTIVNGIPAICCVCDRQDRILFFNNAFEKLTSFKADKIAKANFTDFVVPAENCCEQSLPYFTSDTWKSCFLRTNTAEHIATLWADVSLADGLTFKIGLDGRTNKKIEQELRQYMSLLKDQTELIDLSHDSIIIHDLDGKITFWNQGSEALYGWKRNEVLGSITHEVLKTRFCEPMVKIIAAVSSSGKWDGELINTTKNNQTVTIDSRWALRKDADGTPTAILEIDRDITRRKEDEQIAREALEYAESIIQTVSEALVVLTPDLKVAGANERFYQMFGFGAEDVLDRPLDQLGSLQWNIPELKRMLNDILPNNLSIEEYVMEYNSFYTGRKTLHLNARQISENARKPRHILLAIHDITALKHQEQMLKEMTEQLLLSEELQRQQIATTLHDKIGQGLAYCKHELNILAKNSGGQMQQSLRNVLNSINDAIEQSRAITMDLSSPTLHTFGLEAGIEEMAERFTHISGISCSVQVSDVPKPLEKKVSLLLYRSVKELLENAAKHAAPTQVSVHIDRVNDYIRITVADNGCGFDTSCLADLALADKGVGLYSINQRTNNIGGSFKVDSKIGNGTTIILQAPLYTEGNKGEKQHDH